MYIISHGDCSPDKTKSKYLPLNSCTDTGQLGPNLPILVFFIPPSNSQGNFDLLLSIGPKSLGFIHSTWHGVGSPICHKWNKECMGDLQGADGGILTYQSHLALLLQCGSGV